MLGNNAAKREEWSTRYNCVKHVAGLAAEISISSLDPGLSTVAWLLLCFVRAPGTRAYNGCQARATLHSLLACRTHTHAHAYYTRVAGEVIVCVGGNGVGVGLTASAPYTSKLQ